MKKILLILVTGYLISFDISGQWPGRDYPGRQLSELNQSELQNLYKKSITLKNTGKGLSITGFVATGIATGAYVIGGMVDFFSLLATGEGSMPSGYYNFAGGILLGGLAVVIIGAPMWSTGASRAKKISVLPNFANPKTSLGIAPSFQFNRGQNKFVPGVTVSLRFLSEIKTPLPTLR